MTNKRKKRRKKDTNATPVVVQPDMSQLASSSSVEPIRGNLDRPPSPNEEARFQPGVVHNEDNFLHIEPNESNEIASPEPSPALQQPEDSQVVERNFQIRIEEFGELSENISGNICIICIFLLYYSFYNITISIISLFYEICIKHGLKCLLDCK